MAKVILICGRLCCGKTTYAKTLCQEQPAVNLSLDELMLEMFGEYLGDRHEECAAKCRKYLLGKSLELLVAGTTVILDWGFWSRKGRRDIRLFYQQHGYETEFHYLSISQEEWQRRVSLRNAQIDAGVAEAYHVDEELAAKAELLFEKPDRTEMDVWVIA